MMNISSKYPKALICLLVVAMTAEVLGSGKASLTSSFFGTVSVDGGAVPDGTAITATIGGVELETTSVVTSPEGSSFRIDVPGDVPETPADEGGVDGETMTFRIGNSGAPETGVWRFGQVQRIDLTAEAGPDLGVTQDDGRDTVHPAENLTYSLTIINESAEAATGVLVTDELPPGVTLIVASDGGSEAGGTVSWPAFDLAGGASVVRTLTVELAPSFPAGVETLTLTAMVTDDGGSGFDPDASNNTAADIDTLDAAPDLAVSKTDGLDEVSPGDDLSYTLTITNAGTQDAAGVTLNDTLPEGVTFFTASDDGIETPPGTVTWPAFDLAVGETVERTIQLRFDGNAGTTEITNTATATPGNGPDSDPSDNTGSDVTAIAQRIDLEVVAVDASTMVTDLQSLAVSGTVRVEIENLGNGDATAFEISVWEDSDDDGLLTGADNLLAQAPAAGAVLAGETAGFDLSVAGTVGFRNNLIYAFADSAEEIVELDETNNTGNTAEGCIAVPVPEDFAPMIEVSWPQDDTNLSFSTSVETMSTPIVVQLTDDNGDGAIDDQDTPDIVFVTANLIGGIDPQLKLRAIRGDTGRSLWAVDPPGQFLAFSLSGLAAGDIDGDGIAEIIVATPEPPFPPFDGFGNKIAAYEHTGQLKWTSSAYYETHPTGSTFTNRDNPTIADLEGDGSVEIIVGGNVFRSNGSLRWAGTGGQAYQSARNADNVDSGSISIVADLDLDGIQEVVAGNTAYRADGSIYWQVAMDDGYPAVGNFDADDEPEIVVVARGRVRLHEHDGTLIWGPVDLPGTGDEAGGAPTVADFDNDGEPEIGVAGSTQYAVFETDGTIKWQRTIQDGSSNMTGSTVFDFDGDGRYEVVYRDETHLRIYRGADGVVLFEDPFSSFTANEEPVVADVDGDGRAEIIVTSDLGGSTFPAIPTSGLRIYGDANDNWVSTRKIWNQHAYHSDNVAEDGTIPAQPVRGWLSHNTFRANVQPAGQGAFDAADATTSRLTVDFSAYPSLTFGARIGNGGLTDLPAGLPVAFYDGDPDAGGQLMGVAATSGALAPGGFEDLSVSAESPGFGSATVFVVVGDDGAGGGGRRECDLANNRHGLDYSTDPVGLLLVMNDGQTAVQPGSLVTYELAISNASGFDRTGVLLTDVLPPNTLFANASDGGAEAAGTVAWPAFTLPAGTTAIRTLTFQVDPAIPVSVTSLTNSASVTDDGTGGTDPTPENNTASDTNQVLTVSADAGGPYAGDEGAEITFDASASNDRDGIVVSYQWDLDDDGVFDDAAGVTASRAFPDNGTFTVAVRVTDDSGEVDTDSAEVTALNLPPAVDAGPDQTLSEGDATTLTATAFTDPGTDDVHTATIDWGDGSAVEAGVVNQAAGTVAGGHDYPDDGVFTVEVCVTDDDGESTCDSFTATVENVVPIVVEEGDVDLRSWTAEHRSRAGNWVVAADGRSVRQTINTDPSVFIGPFTAIGVSLEGTIRVNTTSDDDFIGFVLGFQPGDWQNPNADFLLVDWKQGNQTSGRRGLAISRVTGTSPDLWGHTTSSSFQELQRGFTRGNSGWADRTTYTFSMETSPSRVRVFVNGTLELDVSGTFNFGGGRFGFYNFSQGDVTYNAFTAQGIGILEGETALLEVPFNDVGAEDTHTATIDWQDGNIEPGVVVEESGSGTVTGAHVYPDDAILDIEVCVEDDDGGIGCGIIAAVVNNLPPTVDAGDDRVAYVGEGLDLAATFTDAGVLDTHTATIDWGDGISEASTVVETGGAGTTSGLHFYHAEGAYTVEVCVTDDDGGTTCDSFEVLWFTPVLDMAIAKTATVVAVRPGEAMAYNLVVSNLATREPTGLVVTDVLPAELDFLGATDGGFFDPGTRTVTWTLQVLPYQAEIPLSVTVAAQDGVPFGTTVVNTAAVTDDGSFGPDVNPADNTDTAEVVLWDGFTPRVDAGEDLVLVEGDDYQLVARFDDALNTTGPALIPEDGLVGYWPFDDREELALDATGGGSFAQLGSTAGADSNDPSYRCSGIAPVAGNACALELAGITAAATSDFVTVDNAPALDFTDAYTLSGWVRVDTGTNTHRPIFFRGAADNATNANDIEVYVQGSSQDLIVLHNRTNGGATGWAGFQDPPKGSLIHLAVTFDGTRLRAYYNGVSKAVTNGNPVVAPPLATGRSWQFGKVDHSAFGGRRRFLDGRIDEVRFYDRALTQAEITALATVTGASETHTATIDWGDGTLEPGTVDALGTVSGSHFYPDDLISEIEVCVTDSAGHEGCHATPLTVQNLAPVPIDPTTFDFNSWVAETVPWSEPSHSPAEWVPDPTGDFIVQLHNTPPSVLYGPFTSYGSRIEGSIRTEGSDDDFIGFVVGYQPGGVFDSSNFLLVDWKQRNQGNGRLGLAVSRVIGHPDPGEYWDHNNRGSSSSRVEEIARGNRFGSVGWERNRDYKFSFSYSPTRFQVWVDDVLELDISGSFANGRFGFYNLSQNLVFYSSFRVDPVIIDEGQVAAISSPFQDAGILDTHTATIDWADGSLPEPGTVEQEAGSGEVTGSHLYLDDAIYGSQVCVTDNFGDTGCTEVEVTVNNVAPAVDAGPDTGAGVGLPIGLAPARFTDPGLLDTHDATVDWGDGTIEPAMVTGADGNGTVSASHVYAALGSYTAEVCVTDDDGGVGCDSLAVVVVGVAVPEVTVTVPDSEEGDGVNLAATFTDADADAGDSHTATVDWGDGSAVEAADVTPSAGGGSVAAGHRYLDDGVYTVEVCVTDLAGLVGCGQQIKTVTNVAPRFGRMDLRRWRQEDTLTPLGNWDVSADGFRVDQTANSRPTIFYGDLPTLGARVRGIMRIEVHDDDYTGFAIGFDRGGFEDNQDADYLLITWKRIDWNGAWRGLRVWRVRGRVTNLWRPQEDPRVELLAAGANYDNQGFVAGTDYRFIFEMTAERLRMWINGALELDVTADPADPFTDGHFGFYNYLVPHSSFRDFTIEAADAGDPTQGLRAPFASPLTFAEGESSPAFEASFLDQGILDVHTATLEWGDGGSEAAALEQGSGFGTVLAGEHAFEDDFATGAEVCVTDNVGDSACDPLAIQVSNLPPVVDAGADAEVIVGEVFQLAPATFIDAGVRDTHAATVHWGDGALEPGAVQQGAGAGSVDAGHVFAAQGTYPVEVCVTDDDGGVGCDSLTVTAIGLPELVATKLDTLAADHDGDGTPSPGDAIAYTIEISNIGSSPASGVMLRDLIPAHTRVVAGSVTTSSGSVTSEDPVEVDLGTLAAGGTASVSFEVEIVNPVPAGTDSIVNQGTVTSDQLPAVLTDDPDLGGDADPTETMITAAPDLLAEKTDALTDDADGNGVPSPGDVLEYTLRIFNNGNTSATAVVLEDAIPEYATIVAGSVTTDRGIVDSEDPVTVTIGEIAGGMDVVTVSFQVVVDSPIAAGVMAVVNQGLVTSTELADLLTDDPETGGDADPTETAILAEPVLTVEKVDVLFDDADGDGVASPGDTLLYQLTVDNDGNTAATGVVLADPIPQHTALEAGSLQTSQGTIVSEDPIEIALGQVNVGVTATVSFRVRIDDPFSIDALAVSNQATVSSVELADIASDDPDAPGEEDPTATEVFITPEVQIDDVTVTEGDPGDVVEAVFTVSLSEAGNRPATVSFYTTPGSATADLDYTSAAGNVTFAPGETTQTIAVSVLSDLLDEPDETFIVSLADAEGGTLADGEGAATILDDDPPPLVSITGATVTEGDAGTTDAIFAVTLSAPSGFDVTVDYLTLDGTALAGLDYQARAGTVLIPAGGQTATVAVPVLSDLLDEPDETFNLQLTGATNSVLAVSLATGTILDDDDPPAMAIDDVSVDEGDSGTTGAVFTLSLSSPSGFDITVNHATVAGSAEADADYQSAAGTATIPAGSTSGTVTVEVIGDVVDELDETFTVVLSDPVHVTLADGTGEGTIVDDDEALISIDDMTVEEGDQGETEAIFTVSLSTPSDRTITVDYQTADGGSGLSAAVAGADYLPASGTVALAAGETERTVAVTVLGDLILEPDEETFTVDLSNPVNTAFGDDQGLGTILDDEACEGPNLLENPGAEARPEGGDAAGGPPPGWFEVEGEEWQRRFADPDPASGAAYFSPGGVELAELAQDVDVSAYAVRIADGVQLFAFDGLVHTRDEVPLDVARIVVEYRNATGAVLEAYDSGEIASPFDWHQVSDVRIAPAGTAWIRVRLLAARFTDGANDGYLDDLSLRSLRTATLQIDDVTVHEGDAGTNDAVFTVSLSCPYERELEVSFATADGTALDVEDYLASAGTLVLPAGGTTAEIAVPVVGDEIHERHESFTVTLSALLADGQQDLGQAVLLDPVGLGTILNDDFCPRSPGFWKTHVEDWPTDHLLLGGVEYDAASMLDILSYNGPDAAFHLARQLVATRLNLLVGSDLFILPVVEAADAFLADFPPGSNPRGDDRQLANALKSQLDDYNNLDCEETPVDPGNDGGSP